MWKVVQILVDDIMIRLWILLMFYLFLDLLRILCFPSWTRLCNFLFMKEDTYYKLTLVTMGVKLSHSPSPYRFPVFSLKWLLQPMMNLYMEVNFINVFEHLHFYLVNKIVFWAFSGQKSHKFDNWKFRVLRGIFLVVCI